jgi:hypothetical protein
VGHDGVHEPVPVPSARGRRPGVAGAVLAATTAATLTISGCTAPTPTAAEARTPAAPPAATSGGDAGTSSGSGGPALDDEVPAGIAVEIRQSRADWGDRVVQLRVVNRSRRPVVVVSGELSTPTAAGTATTDPARSRVVPVDGHRDFSVALGEAVCPPGTDETDPAAGPAPVAVHLLVADESGRRGQATLVPADPQGHLARVHGEDCAARAVAAGMDLAIGPDVTVADRGGVLVGAVELAARPVAGGPDVSVTAVDRTILLSPVPGDAWTSPDLLDPPTGGARVPLEFTPARCDAHAVAEDKRGTFFGVHATVDGVPQPVFHLGVPDDVRGAVHDYIAAACGWPVG